MLRSLNRWQIFLLAALLLPQWARAGLARSIVIENNVAYLRLAQTDTNLNQEIQSALDRLAATNKIAGIVLDLRFAGGSDVTDLTAAEHALTERSLPLAILVNAQTRGAAATLANDLRTANAGLIFGAATTNLSPDIAVAVSAKEEKDFIKTPYGVMPVQTNLDSATNFLPFADVDRTSEADLVRDKIQDGDASGMVHDNINDDAGPQTNAPVAPQRPFIRDPVLAHGVDFIKGIAALRLNHG